MSRKIMLQHASRSEPVNVSIEKVGDGSRNEYRVGLGDRTLDAEIEMSSGGSGWMRMAGRVVRFFGSRRGEDVQVWYGGRVYDFKILEKKRSTGAGQRSAVLPELTAPMPGTILRILVADGEALVAHQPLIIMESMKMEMTIAAPGAGRVKEITCAEGELVEMGALLVRLQTDGDDEADDE
jgi:acetyl/propionyl-CoA carboxylase alpha subunit